MRLADPLSDPIYNAYKLGQSPAGLRIQDVDIGMSRDALRKELSAATAAPRIECRVKVGGHFDSSSTKGADLRGGRP